MQRKITIENELGLHTRPAQLLVSTANEYESTVTIEKDGLEVLGNDIMGLLMLNAPCGSVLILKVEGSDQESCLKDIVVLFENHFYEK